MARKPTKREKDLKMLQKAKAQEAAKGSTPKFVKPGVNGQAITGIRKWG